MEELKFKPGDMVMLKINGRALTFIKETQEDKCICIDANNKEHEIYLVALVPYVAPRLF